VVNHVRCEMRAAERQLFRHPAQLVDHILFCKRLFLRAHNGIPRYRIGIWGYHIVLRRSGQRTW